LLKLENVSYVVDGKRILTNLNMEFRENRKYVILGTNGAGKTSIANIIMGLEGYKPTEGRIYLDDEDITDLPVYERAKRGISFQWQEPVRFKGIKVSDYLKLGGKLKVSDEDVMRALSAVNLSPFLYMNRYVDDNLSGGERKRIELASLLLLKPRYVILDEPDSGIDIMSIDMIVNVIERLVSERSSVIVITHREEIAKRMDEGYLICSGVILMKGESDKLVEYYKEKCDRCDHINIPVNG